MFNFPTKKKKVEPPKKKEYYHKTLKDFFGPDQFEENTLDRAFHKKCGGQPRKHADRVLQCKRCFKEFFLPKGLLSQGEYYARHFYCEDLVEIDITKLDPVVKYVDVADGRKMFGTQVPVTGIDLVKWHYADKEIVEVEVDTPN